MSYAGMSADVLDPQQTVAELLQTYPQTARVLIALKMHCVGCYLMRFCSLDYIARCYHLEWREFLESLEKSISNGPTPE